METTKLEESKVKECTVPGLNIGTKKKYKLWIIEYTIRGNYTKGVAVVKAEGPNAAINLLKADGFYNGMRALYDIQRCEEIDESPERMLIAEQYVSLDN